MAHRTCVGRGSYERRERRGCWRARRAFGASFRARDAASRSAPVRTRAARRVARSSRSSRLVFFRSCCWWPRGWRSFNAVACARAFGCARCRRASRGDLRSAPAARAAATQSGTRAPLHDASRARRLLQRRRREPLSATAPIITRNS